MATNRDMFPTTVDLATTGYWLINAGWNDEYTANSMHTATENTNVNTGATTGATANGTVITITSKSANTDASIAKNMGKKIGKNVGNIAENMTLLIDDQRQTENLPEQGCLPKVN